MIRASFRACFAALVGSVFLLAAPASAVAQTTPPTGCTALELPDAAERAYQRVFVARDSIAILLRSQHGIVAQSPTASHGVLRVPSVCKLVLAALAVRLRHEGRPPLDPQRPNDYVLAFYDFHDYVGVHVKRSYKGIHTRGASPIYIFRKSDQKYMMQSWS